jgi:hypothetical protein
MKTTTRLIIAFLILACTAFAQDKVERFAKAIAHAEGFGVKGAIPTRYHNPGNLRVLPNGVKFPGQVGQGKLYYVIFKNDSAGWAALRHQIEKALSGESRFYNLHTTFRQLAKTYAEVYKPWLKNVTRELGVEPDDTLDWYFDFDHTNYVAVDDFFEFNLLAEAK